MSTYKQPLALIARAAIVVSLFCTMASPLAAQDTSGADGSSSTVDVIQRVAVVRGQGAQLLGGALREIKSQLPAGSLVILIARSEDGGLLYVESGEMGGGWVPASSLLTVNATDLPIHALAPAMGQSSGLSVEEAAASAQDNVAASSDISLAADSATTSIASDIAVYGNVSLPSGRLNLRAGPGTEYEVLAKANPGSQLQVMGRNAVGDWIAVLLPLVDEVAWATAEYVTVDASVEHIPVVAEVPPPPVSTLPVLTVSDFASEGAASSAEAVPPATTGTAAGQTGLSGTMVFNDRVGGTIYGYNLNTDQMWPITGGVDPSISPDGRLVAFTRDGGGNGLYIVNIDGSGERLLYSGQELLRSPKWSPDRRYIVFSRSNGYEDCRLIGGGVCLPDDAILDDLPAELQGTGAVNAVRRLRNQREYFTVLTRIGIDGKGYRDIPSLNKAGAPDWGENGIVYHSSGAGIQWTGDHDGRSTLVTNDELHGYFHDPDWQPNGGRIAFHRKLGGHWQIHFVNSDGSGLGAVTHPVTALVDELPSSVAPAWSPDGRHVVYASNRNSIESAGAWHFWVMDADGSNQRRLPIDVPLYYTFSSEQMISWGATASQ